MKKFEKTTDGVFVNIVGTNEQISSYERFLNYGVELKDDTDVDLKKFTDSYKFSMDVIKGAINKVAKLEEVIMQMRSRNTLGSDVKLSLVREYIYARVPFFRMGKVTKDIRVIVDRMEVWGISNPNQVDELLNNEKFMNFAIFKLKRAMDNEIRETTLQYKSM